VLEETSVPEIIARNLPASHVVHTEAPVAEYEPTEQIWQATLPETALYVPAAHAVHVQAPLAEYEPREQIWQPALPDTALYVPAAHAVHVPPSRPVYPALQRQ